MPKTQPFRMPVKWEDLPNFQVREHVSRAGFRGEDVLLVMNWLEKGMTLGMHSHPFEQIALILAGRMRWTVGDETFEMGAGEVLRVPPNVPHGGIPISDETVINLDIFCPIRDDYRHIVDHQKDDFDD
ncbi:cupin domain-containing protein [Mesorhizobium sp. CAU 1741]|uniref:cupin domain-containing protein n=1 Tax=Mesorhizobium sp. CAU 1741 TaxID=3140366 RepID=UPI00325C2990